MKVTDAARSAVAKLTLKQKLDLCVGRDFWRARAYEAAGIPQLTLTDGPSGLRHQSEELDAKIVTDAIPATCFPALATLGATWDPELAERVGEAIGLEARGQGVGVVLGPGLNIKRSPLGGRNFEYLSEDPLLTGMLGAGWVRGLQSTGTAACPKHFAANSQEYQRFSSDSVVDERTLRELYFAAFEHVVRSAAPDVVMTAYNRINGTYCSDNVWLLEQVLRREWGFEGCVVSDWGGMHSRVAAYRAGCDLAMPGGTRHLQRAARKAIEAGSLDEQFVTSSAERVAQLALDHGKHPGDEPDFSHHRNVARQTALEGHVLLKNEGVLPLPAGARVALVGALAASPRYQGQGSSYINALDVASLAGCASEWRYAQGCLANGTTTDALVADAIAAARVADAAVVVVGLPDALEGEGFDRASMKLPEGMNRLVEAVASACPNTCVVLQCGSPVEIPWEDQVGAILYAGLGGEAGAEATHAILMGAANPCGKLPDTWPLTAEDAPCMGWWGAPHRDVQYREGLYVGYRYYQSADVPVRYPFGHGLSYAHFGYSDLQVFEQGVRLMVTNESDVAGTEVVQVYVEPPAEGPYRPRRVLAGFARVEVAPHELRLVEVPFCEHAFSVWLEGAWRLAAGTYGVAVGSSVADVRLHGELVVEGERLEAPAWQQGSWYEQPSGKPSQEDFERLLGRPVPPEVQHGPGSYDETDSLEDLAKSSRAAKRVADMVRWGTKLGYRHLDEDDPSLALVLYASVGAALFTLVNNSQGAFPEPLAQWLIRSANRRR